MASTDYARTRPTPCPLPRRTSVRFRWEVRKGLRALGVRRPLIAVEGSPYAEHGFVANIGGLCPCGNPIVQQLRGDVGAARLQHDWLRLIVDFVLRDFEKHIREDTAEGRIP